MRGTLSEIGFARSIGRPVIALRSWELSGRERMEGAPGVFPADSAREAVELALESLWGTPSLRRSEALHPSVAVSPLSIACSTAV